LPFFRLLISLLLPPSLKGRFQ